MGSIMFINKSAEIKGQQKTVTPSTSQQVILPDAGYNALTSVTVSPVTANIDNNIVSNNIKKGVSILGVTGVLDPALQIAPTNTFTDATAKQFYDIQTAYDNMQPKVLTDTNKTIDKSIYCIPTKSDGTPLLDTSNVTDMYAMFHSCEFLKTVPKLNTSNVLTFFDAFYKCHSLESFALIDTSKATSIKEMFVECTNLKNVPAFNIPKVTEINGIFYDCINLTNESLNNILLMLTTATAYIAQGTNMTLKYIGLKEEQATKCKTLSNWAACEAAGWTTGY